jgi:hydroxyethylthiazole kinase-like uncharacterized protein yjeF
MAGLGARVAGAGLVSLVAPNVSRLAMGALLPEATFTKLSSECVPPRADVIVAGMGLGTDGFAEGTVTRLLSGGCGRLVLDADALTILSAGAARGERSVPAAGKEVVLTPHEGEAARLLGCSRESVASDRMSAAKEIARRYGATVVLKGAGTIVVSADCSLTYINQTGNPFMALGGMGDLLAGMIGARWAYLKGDPFLAASSAVWLHGAASDRVVSSPRDASIVNTAAEAGSLRVMLDSSGGRLLP